MEQHTLKLFCDKTTKREQNLKIKPICKIFSQQDEMPHLKMTQN